MLSELKLRHSDARDYSRASLCNIKGILHSSFSHKSSSQSLTSSFINKPTKNLYFVRLYFIAFIRILIVFVTTEFTFWSVSSNTSLNSTTRPFSRKVFKVAKSVYTNGHMHWSLVCSILIMNHKLWSTILVSAKSCTATEYRCTAFRCYIFWRYPWTRTVLHILHNNTAVVNVELFIAILQWNF